MSQDVRPFEFHFPDEDLSDLRERLARTRWPEAETTASAAGEAPNWAQGTPLSWAQDIAEYWRTSYDWRAAEARLAAATGPHSRHPAVQKDVTACICAWVRLVLGTACA